MTERSPTPWTKDERKILDATGDLVCEAEDVAYWQVNLRFCAERPGWREWQKDKDMKDIIPVIDRVLEGVDIKLGKGSE